MTYPFERFLNVRAAYAPSFSPDGTRLAFISNFTGVPQAYAMRAEGGWPDLLTFADDRVMALAWSPAGDRIAFARDVGSNENAQIYLVNADGSDEQRLTHDDGAMHILGPWRADGQALAFAANRRARSRYDLYLQPVGGGEARRLWQNEQPGSLIPIAFASEGERLLVALQASSMNVDLYEVSLADGGVRHLTPHAGEARFLSANYAADGRSVYCASDLDRDRCAVVRLNLASLALEAVVEPAAEVEHLAVSPDGRWLAWAENVAGAHALRACDLHSGETLTADLPLGALYPAPADFGSEPMLFAPAGGRLALAYTTPTRTMDVWVWDLAANAARPVTRSSHGGLPASAFTQPELVRYPTFDGRSIPAWFFRSSAPGRSPVVVYVHGGPEGQTQALFYPILQYLAHRGYHVLAPNVRGSSGYGKAYLNLDNVEKRMDSVADVAHAVHWLRDQPGVQPDRIAVYGGSYGGFMVLAALTNYPELWAAGVDLVGIANFVTFLENTGAYRRAAREAEYGSLARDRALLERISPIHQADRIRAPLFVAHGANDPRVPLGEAQQVVAALEARGIPVEFRVYDDEGHGIVKLANKLDLFPRIAAFLDRHLRPG